jgi:hypothetical protein
VAGRAWHVAAPLAGTRRRDGRVGVRDHRRPARAALCAGCLPGHRPFGDQAAWTYPPASGKIAGGWLHGRGSSDSKAGAAIFARGRAPRAGQRAAGGQPGADVRCGRAHREIRGRPGLLRRPGAPGRADGVMIGYPGPDHLMTGGRGVLRAQLHARGIASHSGGRTATRTPSPRRWPTAAADPLGDPRRHPRGLPQRWVRHHLLAQAQDPLIVLGPLKVIGVITIKPSTKRRTPITGVLTPGWPTIPHHG